MGGEAWLAFPHSEGIGREGKASQPWTHAGQTVAMTSDLRKRGGTELALARPPRPQPGPRAAAWQVLSPPGCGPSVPASREGQGQACDCQDPATQLPAGHSSGAPNFRARPSQRGCGATSRSPSAAANHGHRGSLWRRGWGLWCPGEPG